ncbi:hypothetical protein IU485_28140 [Nocardia cyriacigeorgica]|nr:hypothetical protein [Nocardia cyriacigeorgica]MBF6085243.1 hypothetical protein [Nocardia cyriacigeorgica]
MVEMGGWNDAQVAEWARKAHAALESDVAEVLDLEAGLQEIVGEAQE